MAENQETAGVIDLRELFGVLLHRIWVLLLAAVIGCVLAFGYTKFFVKPMYRSSAMLYVNNSSISLGSASYSITSGEITAAQRLVDTYIVILKSRTFLEEVAQTAGVNYGWGKLSGMISAEAVNETQVFRVYVTGPNADENTRIANVIADQLPVKIESTIVGSDLRVVDYAITDGARISPSFTRNVMLGGGGALLVCVAVFVVLFLLDEKIHSEDYLTQTYPDIPLLSVIPDMQTRK